MVWIEIACFGRGGWMGWTWGWWMGCISSMELCVFCLSSFPTFLPSWRVISIVTARHKCNTELPTGPLNCIHLYR